MQLCDCRNPSFFACRCLECRNGGPHRREGPPQHHALAALQNVQQQVRLYHFLVAHTQTLIHTLVRALLLHVAAQSEVQQGICTLSTYIPLQSKQGLLFALSAYVMHAMKVNSLLLCNTDWQFAGLFSSICDLQIVRMTSTLTLNMILGKCQEQTLTYAVQAYCLPEACMSSQAYASTALTMCSYRVCCLI